MTVSTPISPAGRPVRPKSPVQRARRTRSRTAPARRTERPAAPRARRYVTIALALVAAHVVLALLMKRYPAVSTLHAWGTLSVGLLWAVKGRPTAKLACLGSYIAGADVLWRMTNAAAFWEMGKYALIAIFLIGMQKERQVRRTAFPLGYIMLLIPAAFVTLAALDFGLSRRQISFNLSGPLALAVSAAFFSRLHLKHEDVVRILASFLLPVFAVWTLVVMGIATATHISFVTDSNSELSGGFGPNQVSLTLGCGALVAFLMAVFGPLAARRNYRLALLVLALGLAAQSALTFSRSGVYLAVASGVGACALMARDNRRRTALLGSGVILYVIAAWVVAPRLNDFTHGQLGARFAETQTTGRAELMKADLAVWKQHPFLGVGPGMATSKRVEYGDARKLAAHSEFTRVLSEHGLLGLTALGWLCLAAYRNTMRVGRLETRAIVGALVAFGLLFMLTNAMRLALCSFLIGVCFAEFDVPDPARKGREFLRQMGRRAAHLMARRRRTADGERRTANGGRRTANDE